MTAVSLPFASAVLHPPGVRLHPPGRRLLCLVRTALLPRTRWCPPPMEDDVDLVGYLLLLLLFLGAVWQ